MWYNEQRHKMLRDEARSQTKSQLIQNLEGSKGLLFQPSEKPLKHFNQEKKPLKHFNQENGTIRIIFLKDYFGYNVNNAFKNNGRE